MTVKLIVVGTGSAGNCYILESDGSKLILDAGMPMKKIIQVSSGLHGVEGCLVTHEHRDHSSSVYDMVQYGVDSYMTHGTSDVMGIKAEKPVPFWHEIEMKKPIMLEHFTVFPFPTEHDAQEPCGFLIKERSTRTVVLYATDTYYLRNTFPNVNYWIIECNYIDEIMKSQAEHGLIDRQLTNRLRKSHMSLSRLKQTLKSNDLSKTVKIILVHLSDARSDEEQMVKEISDLTGKEVIAADAGMVIDMNITPF